MHTLGSLNFMGNQMFAKIIKINMLIPFCTYNYCVRACVRPCLYVFAVCSDVILVCILYTMLFFCFSFSVQFVFYYITACQAQVVVVVQVSIVFLCRPASFGCFKMKKTFIHLYDLNKTKVIKAN